MGTDSSSPRLPGLAVALGLLLTAGATAALGAEPMRGLRAQAPRSADVTTASRAARETCADGTCGLDRRVGVFEVSWTLEVPDVGLRPGTRAWLLEVGAPEPRPLDGVWMRATDCGADCGVPLGADPGLQLAF